MLKKMNTFNDFVDSAKWLIGQKYTSPDRLVIQGGSAGGLLMGAVMNQAPELFKASIVQVPFVDVMNTMIDETLPLTTEEWVEWGNPRDDKKAWDYMYSYSPYDQIQAKKYPNMLVQVSLNDSQVPYWEGAKYVAKLRDMKKDDNVILLKTNMGAGHGGSSGRYDRLKEIASPSLVLATKDDVLVPYTCSEKLAAGLPNATLTGCELVGMVWRSSKPPSPRENSDTVRDPKLTTATVSLLLAIPPAFPLAPPCPNVGTS